MKLNDRMWKLIAAAFVVALFYVGAGLHGLAGSPLTPRAQAQLVDGAMTQDAEDVLITSSVDGKTLYIWTFGPWHLNERRIPELKRVVCAGE